MTSIPHFAPDYAAARQNFLEACDRVQLGAISRRNPSPGPDGAALYTDFACFGEEDAAKVLIVNSATHGIEGFCGSAAIVGWLHSGVVNAVPADIKVVIIHALNPHGFAWLRRVNEDNVDLNRNFIAHCGLSPSNPDYESLHPHFMPDHWNERSVSNIEQVLAEITRTHGLLRMQARVCRGQYQHPRGVFYGGNQATWSNRLFERIVARHALAARHIVLLDFHTGLGAYGKPELICAQPPDEKVRGWFRDRLTCAQLDNAVGPRLTGTIGQGLRRAARDVDVYSITVEFGTYDVNRVLIAILADNWLHARGDLHSGLGASIKREIRASFYPDDGDWRGSVLAGSQRILMDAVNGLARL